MKLIQPGYTIAGYLPKMISESGLNGEYKKASDEYWMHQAYLESFQSMGISNPNPAVGCVLVKEGLEIARGATEAYRFRHAETVALSRVKNPADLKGATAYITLEPCNFEGHQPACAKILSETALERVVVAVQDPHPRVDGSGLQLLQGRGIEVSVGCLQAELTAWHLPFFTYTVLKRPVFALKWAQTLDGQLADDFETSKWISGPLARKASHCLRQKYDAVLIGVQTALLDRPQLNIRNDEILNPRPPLRIVLDLSGRLSALTQDQLTPLLQSIFSEGQKTLILTQASPEHWPLPDAPELRTHFLHASFDCSNASHWLELFASPLFSQLIDRPLQSVLIEGGPKTLTLFAQMGLADLAHVFLASRITGGQKNRLFLSRTLASALSFDVLTQNRLGPDVLIEMISKELSQKLF